MTDKPTPLFSKEDFEKAKGEDVDTLLLKIQELTGEQVFELFEAVLPLIFEVKLLKEELASLRKEHDELDTRVYYMRWGGREE